MIGAAFILGQIAGGGRLQYLGKTQDGVKRRPHYHDYILEELQRPETVKLSLLSLRGHQQPIPSGRWPAFGQETVKGQPAKFSRAPAVKVAQPRGSIQSRGSILHVIGNIGFGHPIQAEFGVAGQSAVDGVPQPFDLTRCSLGGSCGGMAEPCEDRHGGAVDQGKNAQCKTFPRIKLHRQRG